MEMRAHIEFPQTGIEFSELKKIFSVFEETCKNYSEDEFNAQSGRVLSVSGGSIWMDFILPVAKEVLPCAIRYLAAKLTTKRKISKRRMYVEIETAQQVIHILIEE